MAKRIYVGVDGIARKVKMGYVGVLTEVPVYGQGTVSITDSNIATVFDVDNRSYYFKGSGSTFTTTNGGEDSSTAITILTAKNDMSVSFNYSYSSESNYDIFTLTVAGKTIENGVSGATTSKSYSGNLTKGQSIDFRYSKDGSASSNDDKCTFSSMVVTTTTQVGAEQKSIARKIKKAYVGIGGVARPCFNSGKLTKYGVIDPISGGGSGMAAVSLDNHAFFTASYLNQYAFAYDKSLVKSQADDLTVKRYTTGYTRLGNYALFGGGSYSSSRYDYIDAYDDSLVRTTPATLSTQRASLTASSIGNYALFAGGYGAPKGGGSYGSRPYVDAVSTSLVRTEAPDMSNGFSSSSKRSTSVGNYALIPLGSTLECYTASLTHTVIAGTNIVSGSAPTTVGNYALFAGGDGVDSDGYHTGSTRMVAIDSSLTESLPTQLHAIGCDRCAVTLDEYALISGGSDEDFNRVSTVEVYDSSLTKSMPGDLSLNYSRSEHVATTLGDYAIIGVGMTDHYSGSGSAYVTSVEVYTII